jgi:hypothetical protein
MGSSDMTAAMASIMTEEQAIERSWDVDFDKVARWLLSPDKKARFDEAVAKDYLDYQSSLKTSWNNYESERDSIRNNTPLWSRILFCGDTREGDVDKAFLRHREVENALHKKYRDLCAVTFIRLYQNKDRDPYPKSEVKVLEIDYRTAKLSGNDSQKRLQ